MNNSPYISVVIPVLEEEANIQVLYGQVVKTLEPLKHSFELLFIDDGSKDRTFDILKRINSHDARAKVIRFRRNYGQTAATAAGFRFAQGEVIVTLDGDLQNDPADIPLLLSKLGNGYDIVCGWRKKRRDNF